MYLWWSRIVLCSKVNSQSAYSNGRNSSQSSWSYFTVIIIVGVVIHIVILLLFDKISSSLWDMQSNRRNLMEETWCTNPWYSMICHLVVLTFLMIYGKSYLQGWPRVSSYQGFFLVPRFTATEHTSFTLFSNSELCLFSPCAFFLERKLKN